MHLQVSNTRDGVHSVVGRRPKSDSGQIRVTSLPFSSGTGWCGPGALGANQQNKYLGTFIHETSDARAGRFSGLYSGGNGPG